MPELPEVETTLRGIELHIKNQKIKRVIIRNRNLRWPIPSHLNKTLKDQVITNGLRRGKYLLFTTAKGTLILHLGMSGNLRILPPKTPPQKHDHLDIEFTNHKILRLTDPRRFGACLWTDGDPLNHFLLKNLGCEPLSKDFTGHFLFQRGQQKKVAIKTFLMDSKIVVGIGNIYAAEALFAARINPNTPAGEVKLHQYEVLVTAIKKILRASIKQGGTTLKDFLHSEGKPGYFKLHLKVYGRGNQPCLNCKTKLTEIRIGQRSTVYCINCQK